MSLPEKAGKWKQLILLWFFWWIYTNVWLFLANFFCGEPGCCGRQWNILQFMSIASTQSGHCLGSCLPKLINCSQWTSRSLNESQVRFNRNWHNHALVSTTTAWTTDFCDKLESGTQFKRVTELQKRSSNCRQFNHSGSSGVRLL